MPSAGKVAAAVNGGKVNLVPRERSLEKDPGNEVAGKCLY